MRRKKPSEHHRHLSPTAKGAPEKGGDLRRLYRKLVVTIGLFAISALVGGLVFADWYYGLPDNAQADFVGRQSCAQCHETQHSAWEGSHHDLAMDVAKEATVLGDF